MSQIFVPANAQSGVVTSVTGTSPINASPTTGAVVVSLGVVPVADGGTGQSSLTAYAPIIGGTTATGGVQNATQATYCTFLGNPLSSLLTGGASVATSGNTNILMYPDGTLFEQYNQTNVNTPAPILSGGPIGSGINLAQVCSAANEGIEISQGSVANSKGNRKANVAAAFFVQAKFKVTTDNLVNALFIGFRKAAGYTATLASYSDFATIGIVGTNSPAKIQIQTQLASGGVITTDTTNTWASAASHTLSVLVSSGGVVTYTIDGIAPVVTAAYTMASGQNFIPFIWYQTAAGGAAEVDLSSYIMGNQ